MGCSEKLVEKVNSPNVINLTGNSLLELTAVLKAAAAAVGPDSGPGHLAAAVGTPYVTLFGPTPANRHVPYGCDHLIVQSDLDCVPCYQKQCPEGHARCMETIAVDDVAEKISLALGEAAGMILKCPEWMVCNCSGTSRKTMLTLK